MAGKLNALKRRTEQLLEVVAAQEEVQVTALQRINELLDPQALEGLDDAELVRRYLEAMRLSQSRVG